MLYILLFFHFLSPANELTQGDEGTEKPYIEYEQERWVPDTWVRQTITLRRECKPGECGVLRPPIVEGQKLIYIYPTKQKDFVQIQHPIKKFFKHWAKSCWEKEVLDSWFKEFTVRDNSLTAFTGSLEMLSQAKYRERWKNFLVEQDPKTLIFLLQTPEKPYSTAEWKKLLANIPKYLGCVLMAPPTQLKNRGMKKHFKNMNRALEEQGGNCQFVRADDEIFSMADAHKDKIFLSNGRLTEAGQNEWWRCTKIQLCETDPLREVSGSKKMLEDKY